MNYYQKALLTVLRFSDIIIKLDVKYLFYFETLGLEIWRLFKTVFYSMGPADYTYNTYFCIYKVLKRLGSILSRSELDPFFIYIWYHTVRTQYGLSLCG